MNNLVIIDYGSGNLRSVQKAFEWLGYATLITVNPEDVLGAAGVIFPGQGSSPPAMTALRASGMDEAIREVIRRGKPFFGVCLGLQVLMDWTEEGETDCLHVLAGTTLKLPPGLKVPHMGWNNVQLNFDHPVFQGVPSGSSFYFVHSYYARPENREVELATTRKPWGAPRGRVTPGRSLRDGKASRPHVLTPVQNEPILGGAKRHKINC